jgi:hypothetical protein
MLASRFVLPACSGGFAGSVTCAPRGPHAPRGPRYRSSAAPLCLTLRVREGGRPGVGCAVFGAQGGLLWVLQSARTRPPRLRRCPPEVGFLLEVSQSARTRPPRLRRCPPEWGETGGFLDVGVLRQGAPRAAVSFMRAPDANLDAQILANKPPETGAAPKARGACPRTLRNCHNARATKRAPDARSAPLPRP